MLKPSKTTKEIKTTKKPSKIKIINLQDCDDEIAREYLDTCFLGWAALEQWNPGIYDMELYFKAYPKAFYVLEVLHEQPIKKHNLHNKYEPAAILFAPYDPIANQASVGIYISEKNKYRGKGYGYQLWKHVLKKLDQLSSQKSTKFLYGVPKQVSNYEKSGFKTTHNIIHYLIKPDQKFGPFPVTITEYNSKLAPKLKVLTFIKQNYSVGFAKFLEHGATKKDVCIQVAIDPKGKKIIGVGISRPLYDKKSYRYAIITKKGPYYAADSLFRSLNRSLTDKNQVVIDVRENALMQKTYENYCKCSDNSTSQKKYGQHWTTEMSTNPLKKENSKNKNLLETHAEPSLETNFLRI